MKFSFLLFATCFTTCIYAQNDTVLYFSNLNKPVQSASEAAFYEKLVTNSPEKFTLSYFRKTGEKWKKISSTTVKRESDTSYKMMSSSEIIRIYHKCDSGYLINDVQTENNNLFFNRTGFSKRVFPLIRNGNWKSYNPVTGDLIFEDFYKDNLWISNIYWINDSSFIRNVYSLVEEHAGFEGGESALMDVIYSNINYPFEAKRFLIQGTVSVGLIVLANGQLNGLRVLNVADKSLSIEALRVIKMTQGKWIPARNDNKNVNSFVILPVTFRLQ
jgi:hypothetical protein